MGRPRTLDLTGQVFNYLTVINRSEEDVRKWNCLCECGNICQTTPQRLRSGRAKSCGCLKSKLLSDANRKHGGYVDGKNTPEYQSYLAMMHRCYDEKRASWERYGGKGIIVEESSWLEESPNGYLNFLADMGKRPEGTSLDRIDNSGNYSKENCRWADRRTQSYNTDSKKTDRNRSKYRGGSYSKSMKRPLVARIGNGVGGYEWLGDYETEDLAAEAYNNRAVILFGDEAKLNIIPPINIDVQIEKIN